MRRFFVSPENLNHSEVILKDDEFHHLKNVCRLQEGERVELLDGKGKLALSEIIKIEKKQARLKVLETKKLTPLPEPYVEIVLSLPRFQKMDTIIQKSAELGVRAIYPIFSERSFVKKKSQDLDKKIHRWNKISLEACKQSGRAWPLEIHPAQNLKTMLEASQAVTGLFLFEGESAQNIKEALAKIAKPSVIRVFIGAEGGFSPQEVDFFTVFGLKPVTLGELVLRVETACIAVTSVIKYHFDLMR